MNRPLRSFKAIMSALICTSCALMISTSAAAAPSEAYPDARPLSLIVPYPAGGASDASARIFAEAIDSFLNKNVVVENIGGATGTIAARRLLSNNADGYTFFHGSPNELILPTLINQAVTFKPEDFELVQAITSATIVLLTRADLDVKNVDDLIRLTKSQKDKPLTYASVGTGSLYHLITERLKKETGANVEHIPYRGASPALIDLAGGQVDFAVLAFQTSMLGLQEQGRIKILAALSSRVPEPLKDIPNVRDSELLKNFDYDIMAGYFVKKGTSDKTKQALRAAIGHALKRPDVREKLEIEGRIVFQPRTLEENEDMWRKEIENLRALVEMVEFAPI